MILEEKQLEVFGTKEVAVKEFMGSSDKSLVLLSDYAKAKENLHELKEKHQDRLEELVAIEKLTSDELKELNGIRAELREPRYLIQNIEKNNISVFESYKKTDKANLKDLIEINVTLEDKATTKLQAEEQRKKDEKELAEKAEQIRIDRIKSDIENIETYCYNVIQKMTFKNLKSSTKLVDQSLNGEYDFEEYDLMLDQVKERVAKTLMDKTNDITARENQRLENEAMKQEIFQVRVNRLKEVGFELVDKLFVSKDIESTYAYDDVYGCDSTMFENVLLAIKKTISDVVQEKRDAELKKQKDEQFEIRKNRLFEIGFGITDNLYFMFSKEFPDISIPTDKIFHASITEFEQILVDAKKSIADAKEQKEIADKENLYQERVKILLKLGLTYDSTKEYPIFLEGSSKLIANREVLVGRNKEWFDKFVSDVEKAIKERESQAKKKSDSENKARVKRLAYGKEFYESILKDELSRFPIMYDSDQPEIKEFSVECSNRVSDLLKELLTKLNEL